MKGWTQQVAVFVMVAAVLMATPARAEEIRLVSSVAARAVVEALLPGFQRATKHTVTPVFGIAADLKTKIEAGEPFDVAILTAPLLDDLIARAVVDRTSRSVVARSGLGFMIKAGAPKPG